MHNFRLRIPKGTPKGSSDLWSHPVIMVLLLRKKAREKSGHAQNKLPVRAPSGHVTLSLPVKRPYYGGYGATSGCACAEHTSGQGHFLSRDWRHFRSCHFRLLPIAPPQIRLCPSPYTTEAILSFAWQADYFCTHKIIEIHKDLDHTSSEWKGTKNISLSFDEWQIHRALTLEGCDIELVFRERLRADDKLRNYETRDRQVISKTLISYPGQNNKGNGIINRSKVYHECLQTDKFLYQCSNVSEWGNMSFRGLLFQWARTKTSN